MNVYDDSSIPKRIRPVPGGADARALNGLTYVVWPLGLLGAIGRLDDALDEMEPRPSTGLPVPWPDCSGTYARRRECRNAFDRCADQPLRG
jgi:hypothetical protein